MIKLTLTFVLMAIAGLLGACNDGKTSSASEDPPPTPGEITYTKNCKVCHAQGINGAPILGNTAMWGPRLKKGEAALVANALGGFGLMPAKGGKTELQNDEVKGAVKFMVSQVNSSP